MDRTEITDVLKTAYEIVDEVLPVPDHAAVIRGRHAADLMGLRQAALPVVFNALTSVTPARVPPEDQLMTMQETMLALGVSYHSVHALYKNGELHGVKVSPRNLRIYADSVRAYKRKIYESGPGQQTEKPPG
jgi:hypothetical protein